MMFNILPLGDIVVVEAATVHAKWFVYYGVGIGVNIINETLILQSICYLFCTVININCMNATLFVNYL